MEPRPRPVSVIKLQAVSKQIDKLLNGVNMLLNIEERRKQYNKLQAELTTKTVALWANQDNPIVAGLIRTDMRDIQQQINEILQTNITESEVKQ